MDDAPKYGKQFEVRSCAAVLPATIQGIQRYLGSGLINGIGPVMAERMVQHFGTDVRLCRQAHDSYSRIQVNRLFLGGRSCPLDRCSLIGQIPQNRRKLVRH